MQSMSRMRLLDPQIIRVEQLTNRLSSWWWRPCKQRLVIAGTQVADKDTEIHILRDRFDKGWSIHAGFHTLWLAADMSKSWMFPKIVGFPPKSSILIGCSIIFTIHFGGFTPILGNTQLLHWRHVRQRGSPYVRKTAAQCMIKAHLSMGRNELFKHIKKWLRTSILQVYIWGVPKMVVPNNRGFS